MNNNLIEQTLHGYRNGHNLISSSLKLPKILHRKMLELSDLSGSVIIHSFDGYLTGYPLPDEGYYVIAKTWYATEKDRPGCVWTHSLLFPNNILNQISDPNFIIEKFKKPKEHLNFDDYSCSLNFFKHQNFNVFNLKQTQSSLLEHLLYEYYENDTQIFVPSSQSSDYEALFLYFLLLQPSSIRSKFTFSTGSLSNRKIGKEPFNIQIVPDKLLKTIQRTVKHSKVLDINNISKPQSLYFNRFASDIISFKEELRNFLIEWDSILIEKFYFKKLIHFFYDNTNTIMELNYSNLKNFSLSYLNFYEILKILFVIKEKSATNDIIYSTLDIDIRELIIDISSDTEIVLSPIENIKISGNILELFNSDSIVIHKLLISLINLDHINIFGEFILKQLAMSLKTQTFQDITQLEIGPSQILITLNPDLLLNEIIWKQSENYQLALLSTVQATKLSDIFITKLIENILNYTESNLIEQLFTTFNSGFLQLFLQWSNNNFQKNKNKIATWLKICSKAQTESLVWIFTQQSIERELIILILSHMDPFYLPVDNQKSSELFKLFDGYNLNQLDYNSRLVLAKFYLPIILRSSQNYTNNIIKYSYQTIYNLLKNNALDHTYWTKLEALLPEPTWILLWDRCRMLKNGMKQHGYQLDEDIFNFFG